jgi:VCBS repeat-containing protein
MLAPAALRPIALGAGMRATTSGKFTSTVADLTNVAASPPAAAADSDGSSAPGHDALSGNPVHDLADHLESALSTNASAGGTASAWQLPPAPEWLGATLSTAPDTPPAPDDGGTADFMTSEGALWFNDNGSLSNSHSFAQLDDSDWFRTATSNNSEPTADSAADGAHFAAFTLGSPGVVLPQGGALHADVAAAPDALGTPTQGLASAGIAPIAAAPTSGFDLPSSVDLPSPPAAVPVIGFVGDLGEGLGQFGSATGSGGGAGTTSGGTGLPAGGSSAGLVIDVVWDASVANAPAGFTTAVDQVVSYFESHFTNPVTVTIDVGYGEVASQTLAPGALGESESYVTSTSYAALQSALVTNANAIGDRAAAASLPASSPVSGTYWLTTAEAEALGLAPGSGGGVNGYVGFSSSYPFAYSESGGVPAGEYDFMGVVAHEISEVMGRQMMDGQTFVGATSYEPLDLFHYSAPGVRDFSGTTAGYFSADAGTTNLGNFNTITGGDYGDWAGSVGNNAFLAFSSSGVVSPITANDLTEMNILGWDPMSSATSPVVTITLVDDTGGTNNVTYNDALTGRADANATVTISEGSTVLGSTTANASGVWSFTPTGLAQGAQTVTASETNAAGLTGSASLTFTYDTVAPTVTIALADDTGGTNNVTSNDALTGTADPNATVRLSEGSTVLGTTAANASGVWSFTPTGLAQGTQTITASEINAAGLTGSTSLTFTYETGAPRVTIALADDTGGTNNVTSNDALTGSADPNAIVTLTEGSTVLGSTTVNGSGVWSFTPTGLAQGTQTVTASETNAAGLTGSASLTFAYDTVAPTVTIALADDTGGTNNVTANDALTGRADPNAIVTLTEGSTVLGSTAANASGVWSFTPTGLAQGTQTVTASETNAAGLTGSASLIFTYDSVATVTIALADDTGGTNNVTSDDTLTGIADPGAVVTLTLADATARSKLHGVLGTATANASGVWSFTPTGLAQGSHTIIASEKNAAGVTGTASLTFTLDSVPPAAPIIITDTVNANNTVTLAGTAEANATVTVFDGQTTLGSTAANASGAWTYTTPALASGVQSLTATATDAAGNTSVASSAVDPVIQANAPTIASFSPDTGIVGDSITAATTLTLLGTAIGNSTVAVFDGSTELGTVTANSSGAWSFTTGTLANGSHSFTATETVGAGVSPASAAFVVTVDTVPPTVTIALSRDTGGTNNVTYNDALSGTADVNATVTISESSTVLGSTTANGSGVWSFTPTGLAQGTQTVAASETNAAGLTGSAALTFTYDTVAPTVTSESISGTGILGGTGTLTAGQSAVLTLGLSEAVTVADGAPSLALNDGGIATYDVPRSTATSLAFDYTVAAGQEANPLAVIGINLNGATVTDLAGNAANFSSADVSFAGLAVSTPASPISQAIQDYAHDVLGNTVSVNASAGVLANISDPNPLDVSSVNGSTSNVGESVSGTYGSLSLNSDGSLTYTNTNAAAVTALGGVVEDTFQFTVSDGQNTTNGNLNVLITSPNDTYITGAAGSTIRGNANNAVLDGSAGQMTLTAGQSGMQWLVGGAGDTLNGNIFSKSTDTFLFPPNFGNETINNFNPKVDVIDLPSSEFANFAAVQADLHASGTSTILTLDATDSITLTNLSALNLHSQNFHFF